MATVVMTVSTAVIATCANLTFFYNTNTHALKHKQLQWEVSNAFLRSLSVDKQGQGQTENQCSVFASAVPD